MGVVPYVEPVVVAAPEVVQGDPGAQGEVPEVPGETGQKGQAAAAGEHAIFLEFSHRDS